MRMFDQQLQFNHYHTQQIHMFGRLHHRLRFAFTSFAHTTFRQANSLRAQGWIHRAALPILSAGYLYYLPPPVFLASEKKKEQAMVEEKCKEARMQEKPRSIWGKIWRALVHIIRFFHLLIIFSPPILLFPLLFFKRTENYWRDLFVKAVQRAGVVFIKAFQYLSHRRDIIGPEMADKFEYLRENAPTHSFETTKKYFRESYGKNIDEIFQQFEEKPIASGSVSQVYRAVYKGKKVAVKVRHPGVDKYIERDINLLFFLSYLASFFSPAMEVPVSEVSLKRTLIEQIDFTFEMRNLNRFNEMFKERPDVNFPFPFEENTMDAVLVETFVQGVPVTYYQKQRHPLNKVIARLGSTTFFEMLMKNNFIHADCHGGNILIEIREKSQSWLGELADSLKEVFFWMETRLKALTFDTEKMKRLYLQSREEEHSIRQLLRRCKEQVVVNLIDVGMVIQLNERDKKNFVNFIKSVIEGKGELCAQMIYNLSNFEGKKILTGKFEDYYQQLTDCFSVLNNQALDDLQGMSLFVDMLTIIRENRMKLDGEFATLLTNMMVLEAIAKDIDPEINILKCAFPYFKYVEDFGVYTQ